VVPFTTSPLDECRGGASSAGEKSPTKLRGYAATATHKKKRRFVRAQNATVRRRY
jgi:hypothetical protein